MQRMTWGAGRDHGIAMPRASAGAGVVDEDEKTPAAVAAKELLGHTDIGILHGGFNQDICGCFCVLERDK